MENAGTQPPITATKVEETIDDLELDIDLPEEKVTPKSIYAMFENDSTMEQQGIVIDFGPGGQFKVARSGGTNQRFNLAFTKGFKKYAKQQRNGTLSEEIATRVLANIYAETIVLDWANVVGRNGQPIVYSKDACRKLLIELPELFREIREHSSNVALYRKEEAEEASGN